MSTKSSLILWITIFAAGIIVVASMLFGGKVAAKPAAASPTAAPDLVFYDWPDDMPQSVIDQFTKETGIKVRYETYGSTEEAVANLNAGKTYDVAVIENEYIPALVTQERLATINHWKVSNLSNLSSDLLNLEYDLGNRYSIPYTWGTTGIVVRTDTAPIKINHWSDLWNPELKGKVGVRPTPRDVIGMTELSLGYSVNTEQPAQVEDTIVHLLLQKDSFKLLDDESANVIPLLQNGEITALVGWSADVQAAREAGIPIEYVIPEEGALYWGDSYVIAANSTNQENAMKFINFLLRPQISATITNEIGYATPNMAAMEFVDPKLRSDEVIFPPEAEMHDILLKAGMILPLSPSAEKAYHEGWARFMEKVEQVK